MDVEENELFVLKGARKTLEASGFPPIVFESNIDTNTALFTYIRTEIGYSVIKIYGCVNMYLATKNV